MAETQKRVLVEPGAMYEAETWSRSKFFIAQRHGWLIFDWAIHRARWYIWEVGSAYNMSMWDYCATLLQSTLLNKTESAGGQILEK